MSTTQEKVFSLGEIGSVQYLLVVLAQVGGGPDLQNSEIEGFPHSQGPYLPSQEDAKNEKRKLVSMPRT